MEALGHEIVRIQEGKVRATEVAAHARGCDLLWWTQTLGLAEQGGTNAERLHMLEELRALGIPSVGFHLDRWWGLDRQDQLKTQAFFRVDALFTADGGHDEEWKRLGINHHWLPPAVYHAEAVDGRRRPQYASDVAFVGSLIGYGHPEWAPYREELYDHLKVWYGRRFKWFPGRNKRAIRGQALNDLYASVKVCVGDSCLVPKRDGSPMTRYISDRVFECTGRGGFLIHPWVEGLPELHPHVPIWELGDWDGLHELIDRYLADDEARDCLRMFQAEHTREHHTYKHRVQAVLETMELT